MSAYPLAPEEQSFEVTKELTYRDVLALTLWVRKSQLVIFFSFPVKTYDWILTLRQEVKYVWRARWTPGKVLLLVVRYAGLVALIPYMSVPLQTLTDDRTCVVLVFWAYCSQNLLQAASAMVLALRTWAIWNRDRICGIIVGLALLSLIICQLTLLVSLLRVSSCFNSSFSTVIPPMDTMTKSFVALALYEGVIFIMTLLRAVRYFHRNTPALTVILYRDAFLASTCISGFAVGSAILAAREAPSFDLVNVLSLVFYSICPARIMLNLREATSELDGWDLTRRVPDLGYSDNRPAGVSESSGWSTIVSAGGAT